MYIKYNEIIYEIITDVITGKELITTYYKEKTDDTFYKRWDYYAKELINDDEKIEDIYDIKCYVYWDSKLEGICDKWEVPISKYYMDDKVVRLQHEGLLSGWKADEKYLCSKCVKLSDIEGYAIKYEYAVKDGIRLEETMIVENKVEKEEFEKIFEQYLENNI